MNGYHQKGIAVDLPLRMNLRLKSLSPNEESQFINFIIKQINNLECCAHKKFIIHHSFFPIKVFLIRILSTFFYSSPEMLQHVKIHAE